VLARLRAGDTAGAKEAALKALALLPDVDAKDRSKAAVGVVRMLFRLDDVPAARKALAQIQAGDPSAGAAEVRLRARLELIAMGYLATAVVRAGRDADAKALLKETARPGDQAYLWHVIALAQARAGRKDEAKVSFAAAFELVGAEANPVGGGTTPHNVICAQALSGDIDGAIRNAARLRAEAPTWGTITSVQIRMKDFAGARETAVFIGTDNMFYYPRTLRLIASAQARAGQAAAVREWAEKLEDKLIRAHALVGLAEGLYREPMKPGP
jgi:hypothetical protein